MLLLDSTACLVFEKCIPLQVWTSRNIGCRRSHINNVGFRERRCQRLSTPKPMYKISKFTLPGFISHHHFVALRFHYTKDWNSDIMNAAPGEIVSESEHATSFLSKGAEDFEGEGNTYAYVLYRQHEHWRHPSCFLCTISEDTFTWSIARVPPLHLLCFGRICTSSVSFAT